MPALRRLKSAAALLSALAVGLAATASPGTALAQGYGSAAVEVAGQGATAQPPPVVRSVSPSGGPRAGGTQVTITGTGLGRALGVAFGGEPASGFQMVSGRELTAVAPTGTGAVDVMVVTPAGISAPTPADVFTYGGAGAAEDASPVAWPGVATATKLTVHLSAAPPSDPAQPLLGRWCPLAAVGGQAMAPLMCVLSDFAPVSAAWFESSGTAVVDAGADVLSVTVGASTASLATPDGRHVLSVQPPAFVQPPGATMVPLTFLAHLLGGTAAWRAGSGAATLTAAALDPGLAQARALLSMLPSFPGSTPSARAFPAAPVPGPLSAPDLRDADAEWTASAALDAVQGWVALAAGSAGLVAAPSAGSGLGSGGSGVGGGGVGGGVGGGGAPSGGGALGGTPAVGSSGAGSTGSAPATGLGPTTSGGSGAGGGSGSGSGGGGGSGPATGSGAGSVGGSGSGSAAGSGSGSVGGSGSGATGGAAAATVRTLGDTLLLQPGTVLPEIQVSLEALGPRSTLVRYDALVADAPPPPPPGPVAAGAASVSVTSLTPTGPAAPTTVISDPSLIGQLAAIANALPVYPSGGVAECPTPTASTVTSVRFVFTYIGAHAGTIALDEGVFCPAGGVGVRGAGADYPRLDDATLSLASTAGLVPPPPPG